MEPIAVYVRSNGEWALVHRCAGCAAVRLNRIAGDDNPLSSCDSRSGRSPSRPFPLEWLSRL
jgi:RNHCP domain